MPWYPRPSYSIFFSLHRHYNNKSTKSLVGGCGICAQFAREEDRRINTGLQFVIVPKTEGGCVFIVFISRHSFRPTTENKTHEYTPSSVSGTISTRFGGIFRPQEKPRRRSTAPHWTPPRASGWRPSTSSLTTSPPRRTSPRCPRSEFGGLKEHKKWCAKIAPKKTH